MRRARPGARDSRPWRALRRPRSRRRQPRISAERASSFRHRRVSLPGLTGQSLGLVIANDSDYWIPACAGMTVTKVGVGGPSGNCGCRRIARRLRRPLPSPARRGGSGRAGLAAHEVAVGGSGAALTRGDLVGVHAEAGRAAGFAPLEARRVEEGVEPSASACCFTKPGAGHDHRAHLTFAGLPAPTLATSRRSSIRPLVQQPMNTGRTSFGDLLPAQDPCNRAISAGPRALCLVRIGKAGRVPGPRPVIGR